MAQVVAQVAQVVYWVSPSRRQASSEKGEALGCGG